MYRRLKQYPLAYSAWIRGFLSWLFNDHDLLTHIGFYALAYHERFDLVEADRIVAERIFQHALDYYKKFIVLPLIEEYVVHEGHCTIKPLTQPQIDALIDETIKQS